MSSDGSNLGIRADRALATILGGDPSPTESEHQSPEQVLARIEAAEPDTYGGSTDCLTRAVLRLFTEREETQVWPTEPTYNWDTRDPATGAAEKTGPDLCEAVKEVMTDAEREVYDGCTGFMWGFAVNQARWLIGQHPGANPAIIEIRS